MRRPLVTILVLVAAAGGAVLAAGCGELTAEAATFTCGQMRADRGRYREQARYLVAHEKLQPRSLSRERSVLDVELSLRRACHGAADGERPYAATRDLMVERLALDSVAAGG